MSVNELTLLGQGCGGSSPEFFPHSVPNNWSRKKVDFAKALLIVLGILTALAGLLSYQTFNLEHYEASFLFFLAFVVLLTLFLTASVDYLTKDDHGEMTFFLRNPPTLRGHTIPRLEMAKEVSIGESLQSAGPYLALTTQLGAGPKSTWNTDE